MSLTKKLVKAAVGAATPREPGDACWGKCGRRTRRTHLGYACCGRSSCINTVTRKAMD